MLGTRQLMSGLLALVMTGGLSLSDEPKVDAKSYKLEFVVKEVSGAKTLNARNYMIIVSTEAGSTGVIRAGSKIPFDAGANQFQQVDVGVNIDVTQIKDVQDRLAFRIGSEISSIAESSADKTRFPIRQNRWNSMVLIPLKKPTLLFSSENVDGKSQMQVEVTATPIL